MSYHMKPVGIVFLYDRKEGNPTDVSKKFADHFSTVSEDIVKEKLIDLPSLKGIMDQKAIYWGGIRKNFDKVAEDEEAIGEMAWQVFNNHTGMECSEEMKSLIYDGKKAPWHFPVIVAVLFD